MFFHIQSRQATCSIENHILESLLTLNDIKKLVLFLEHFMII